MPTASENKILTLLQPIQDQPLSTPPTPPSVPDLAAQKLVDDVSQKAELPKELKPWLDADQKLGEKFFAELEKLGEGDSIEKEYSLSGALLKQDLTASLQTSITKASGGIVLKIKGDVQKSFLNMQKEFTNSSVYETNIEAGTQMGINQTLEFNFKTADELKSVLQNPTNNLNVLMQNAQNPLLFPVQSFFKKEQPKSGDVMSHLGAVELGADATAAIAADLQIQLGGKNGNNTLLKDLFAFSAHGESNGQLSAQARLETDDNNNKFFVYRENIAVGISADASLQISALKNLKIETSTGPWQTSAQAILTEEKRLPLPSDFNLKNFSTETLGQALKNSTESFEMTQSVTFQIEHPTISETNSIVIQGQEATFSKTTTVAEIANSLQNKTQPIDLKISLTDALNDFTSGAAAEKTQHYTKETQSTLVNHTLLGNNISWETSETKIDRL